MLFGVAIYGDIAWSARHEANKREVASHNRHRLATPGSRRPPRGDQAERRGVYFCRAVIRSMPRRRGARDIRHDGEMAGVGGENARPISW